MSPTSQPLSHLQKLMHSSLALLCQGQLFLSTSLSQVSGCVTPLEARVSQRLQRALQETAVPGTFLQRCASLLSHATHLLDHSIGT